MFLRTGWWKAFGCALCWLAQMTTILRGNPVGENVISGDASFDRASSGILSVTQSSQTAIIHWQDFSIGAGELTRFIQPNADAAVLNRVVSGLPSSIMGSLEANGRVFLINPNGILVGPGGRIDVGSFTASTLDAGDGEFLAGGDVLFQGESMAGVTNQGTINAIGGDIFLLARNVENEGSLNAPQGTVGLAAGTEILLKQAGSERVFVRAGQNSRVTNSGGVEAATAELKAHGNVYALAVNNTGVVRASGAVTKGGRVLLTAGGGGTVKNSGRISARRSDGSGGEVRLQAESSGRVENSGTLDASGGTGTGGQVTVLGGGIELHTGAMLNASGGQRGGDIRIGGDFQGRNPALPNALSVSVGDGVSLLADGSSGGGSVIVWSDGATAFAGNITARGTDTGALGGFAEVSGRQTLDFTGLADLSGAGAGLAGTLLLDPTDFTVGSSEASSIISSLASSNVVVSTNGSGGQQGNLTVSAALSYVSANDLTLLAHGNVIFSRGIQNGGTGAVQVVSGWDGVTGFGGSSGVQSGSAMFASIVDAGAYGLENGVAGAGSIQIGSASSTLDVSVGSRFGPTNVAGNTLSIIASNSTISTASQLGYRTSRVSANFNIDGPINGVFRGNVSVQGGSAASAPAMIGHGGLDPVLGVEPDGNLGGKISLSTPGTVSIVSGAGLRSSGQLGHGGGLLTGNYGGDIRVASGNLSVTSVGPQAYAQLGHGGYSASGSHTGSITVVSAGNVTLTGAGTGDGYAQLGHGGNTSPGSHTGDISLTAVNLAMTGASLFSRVQIGHGGNNSAGNNGGKITVALTGGATLQGGSLSRSYAQIGHGGPGSAGNFSGDVAVTIGGNLDLRAGSVSNATQAYALIGHGDVTTALSGTRQGNLDVRVAGESSFVNGIAINAIWNIGHATSTANGVTHADVLFSTGTLDYSTGLVASVTSTSADFTSKFIANLAGGSVTVASTGSGGFSLTSSWNYSSSNALTLLSTTDFRFLLGVQNGLAVGGGVVNIGSGWDGTTGLAMTPGTGPLMNFASIMASPAAYGNNSGSVYIGASVGNPVVAVGSRSGSTQVVGHDLTLTGSSTVTNGYAQLGFREPTAATGFSTAAPITVILKNSLMVAGGNVFGGYAQIGNGGQDSSGGQSANSFGGDIMIIAPTSVSLLAGGGSLSYSQIGNAGHGNRGSGTGSLSVVTGVLTIRGGSGALANALLGNGGYASDGNHSGNISVTAQDVTLQGGLGSTNDSVAQIGHGGALSDGNHSGAIALSVAGNLSLLGGSSSRSPAQIGHGTAGGLTNTGTRQGVIDVRVGGESSLVNGTGITSGWMIRHLTTTASAVSNAEVLFVTGTLDASPGAGATEALLSPAVATNFFSAGFGGPVTIGATGAGGMIVTGAIGGANDLTVISTRDLVFKTSVTNNGSAAVNVGAGWDGVTGLTSTPGAGPLFSFASIQADPSAYSNNAGTIRIGDGTQTTVVNVGSLLGATNAAAYALVVEASTVSAAGVAQFGIRNAQSSNAPINVMLASHFHVINRGVVSSAQIGRGTNSGAGDVFVTSNFDFSLPFSFAAFAAHDVQMYASLQNSSGTGGGTGGGVTLVSGWDGVAGLTGSLPADYAAVEGDASSYGNNGGSVFVGRTGGTSAVAVGSRYAATNVAGANVSVLGSNSSGGAFALLGFRMNPSGAQTDASGSINVRARGDVNVRAGLSTTTYAHIGHGGQGIFPYTETDGDWSGDINISAGGNLMLTGNGPAANVQVGHGGENSRGIFTGNITVFAHDVTVAAGGSSGYAQIGHGGLGALGDTNGVLSVTTTGDISLAGGTSTFAYAQIGNGGGLRTGNHSGAITLQVSGDLSLRAGLGSSSTTYAQVGNGGASSNGNHSGDIMVGVGGDLVIAGAASFSASSSYAMIGHGAGFMSGSGTRTGKVVVSVSGESSLVNGGSSFSPWRIGHQSSSSSSISDAEFRFSTGTFDFSTSAAATGGSTNSDFNTKMISNLAGGPVTVTVTGSDGTNGDLRISSSWSSSSSNRVTFVSTSDITVTAPIFANGSGGLDIVTDAANAARPDININAKFVNSSFVSSAGGVRVFAASPFTSTLGGLSVASRQYDVWYGEAAAITGVNFKLSPVLTLTARDATRLYGESNPPLSFTSSGLVPGDLLSRAVNGTPIPRTTAGLDAPVGNHVIDMHGSLTAKSGYTLVINDGTLTVGPAPLTITASDILRTYGVPFEFAGSEFTSIGLKNGETIGRVLLSSPGADLSAPAQAQPYVISIANPTGGTFDARNYGIIFVSGALVVQPDQRTLSGDIGRDFGPFGTDWQNWTPDPLHEGSISRFGIPPVLQQDGPPPLLRRSSSDTSEAEESGQ